MEVNLTLPAYIEALIPDADTVFETDDDRMNFAIRLSQENIQHGGGPFGCGIFCMDTGRLLAPGVNLVVPGSCSLYHGEITAIMFAQHTVKNFDLATAGNFELVTSAEPCVQCFGAITWSGVRRVVYGATCADVEDIGFDEGPKPADWVEGLKSRNIDVTGPVRRDAAVAILQAYKKAGNPIYNSAS